MILTDAIAKLEEIYKQIPAFNCNVGCADCCGMIAMSEFEEKRIEEKFGCIPPYDFEHHACGFLNRKTNRCKIYEIRPAICRLFGTVHTPLMICPHGCAPFQQMTKFDSHFILHQIAALR